jgi:hypothetical protein
VFDGVDVAILDMASVIDLVADEVFPEAALPYAPLAAGFPPALSLSCLGRLFAKRALMSRHRIEKSASAGDRVHTACKWFGRTTMASIVKGYFCRVAETASRRVSM